MLKGGYTFESTPLLYHIRKVMRVAANEARALRAHWHMALVSQNATVQQSLT